MDCRLSIKILHFIVNIFSFEYLKGSKTDIASSFLIDGVGLYGDTFNISGRESDNGIIMIYQGKVVFDFKEEKKKRLKVNDLLALFDDLYWKDNIDPPVAELDHKGI